MNDINYTKYFDNCFAVFQGGGCKAVAYIGAYEEAYKRGVLFTELAGASAGAVIAALIAAGATPQYLMRLLKDTDFVSLIQGSFSRWEKAKYYLFVVFSLLLTLIFFILILPFVWHYKPRNFLLFQYFKLYIWIVRKCVTVLGLFSTQRLENLLNEKLKEVTNNDNGIVTFRDINPNLHIVASDILNNKEKVWNKFTHSDYSVAKAVCASCAVPLFFRPIENWFVDGGLISNLPHHLFAKKARNNKILNFRLQQENVKEDTVHNQTDIITYIAKLISTIIDGAVTLQGELSEPNASIIIKIPNNIKSLDFHKMNKSNILRLIDAGQKAAQLFFDTEDVEETSSRFRDIYSLGQLYAWVATFTKNNISLSENGANPLNSNCEGRITDVCVSTNDASWVWLLLPTIIQWINNKSKVHIYLPKKFSITKNEEKEKEKKRRWLLEKLGCTVHLMNHSKVEISGFFFKTISATNKYKWQGVVYTEKSEAINKYSAFDKGCYYDTPLDGIAIEQWMNKIGLSTNKTEKGNNETSQRVPLDYSIMLEKINQDCILNLLHKNEIYTNATFEFKEVEIDQLHFLTNQIRLTKYRQIKYLFDLYTKHKLSKFEPAALRLLDNERYIVSPIVIEEHQGKLYVIEGHTRLKYAYHHGHKRIIVLLATNVARPLPIISDFKFCNVKDLVVTDDKEPINQDCVENYRHIEESLHIYNIDNNNKLTLTF